MNSILSIASSGMAVAALQLQVSASNVANMLDPEAPLGVDQGALSGGGTVGYIRPAESSLSGPVPTDLATELVQQILARYTFAANVRVAYSDTRLMQNLLNITA